MIKINERNLLLQGTISPMWFNTEHASDPNEPDENGVTNLVWAIREGLIWAAFFMITSNKFTFTPASETALREATLRSQQKEYIDGDLKRSKAYADIASLLLKAKSQSIPVVYDTDLQFVDTTRPVPLTPLINSACFEFYAERKTWFTLFKKKSINLENQSVPDVLCQKNQRFEL